MLPSKCEVCGVNIVSEPFIVEIDGAILSVCSKCAKLGKPAKLTPIHEIKKRETSKHESIMRSPTLDSEEELVVREDFATVLRNARESMHLTQEQIGMKINEKSSVIAKLESGKMKPSIALAKKLEHVMKIRLLERREL